MVTLAFLIEINVEIMTLFCDAGNENVGGNESGSLFSSSPLNQQQETNPFIDIETDMKDDFSFPTFQWS